MLICYIITDKARRNHGVLRLIFPVRLIALSTAFVAALLAMAPDRAAAEPKVVASIGPLHSLVAAVMEGVGKPALIVKGAMSPHAFTLRPSDATAIAEANLVVWVGESLERPIADAIQALAAKTKIVELTTLAGLRRPPVPGTSASQTEHGHKDHKHDGGDPHVWLDPTNAGIAAEAIAEALATVDSENAPRYRANLKALLARLAALDAELGNILQPVTGKPFIVFHDAYGHFTAHYGLGPVTAVTIQPDRKPGAMRVAEVRATAKKIGAGCIFSEPQFSPAIIKTIAEGTGLKAGILDPIGATLSPGPELYFELMRNLAAALKACLSG